MYDYPSFDEVLATRKQSAAESIRPATAGDLQSLLEKIFAQDPLHPWVEPFEQFVRERESEQAYQGETSDGIGFVFYPGAGKGMWYRYDTRLRGVGVISDRNVSTLREMVH
jgi:hypothetical protein